jgi:MarR family transcriptional regulator for hemolysin
MPQNSENLGPLEDVPAYMLYRVSRLMRFNIQKALKNTELGITPEQYFLLYRLYQKDRVAQSELADEVLGDYPNITRLVDGLVKNNLVQRTPDTNDRRKHLIKLTPKGKRTMKSMAPGIAKTRDHFFGNISQRDLQAFTRVLRSLQSSVLETLKHGKHG